MMPGQTKKPSGANVPRWLFHCSWRWLCAATVAFQHHFGVDAMTHENAPAGIFRQQAEPQESGKRILQGMSFPLLSHAQRNLGVVVLFWEVCE
jgi:hypothetical protein